MSTADYSRHLFQPEKRYTGAFLQQGRVLTDEDLNAHRRLDAEDDRLRFLDIICAKGSPNRGFLIHQLVQRSIEGSTYFDFKARAGSYYLGGLRFSVIAGQPETFLRQSDWLQADADLSSLPQPPTAEELTEAGGERHDLVYLHAWEQTVSATEDSELLERALGGPDTSVYSRRTRRLQVLTGVPETCTDAAARLEEFVTQPRSGDSSAVSHQFDAASCVLQSKARLKVGFTGETSDDLCQPNVTKGYLGAENQAIRIQLTAANRFIWGYDNASPLYRVRLDGDTIEFLTLPRDEFAQPSAGQAVEVIRWGALLPNQEKVAELSGHLTTVKTSYDPDSKSITVEQAVPTGWTSWFASHPEYRNPRDEEPDYFYVRLWTGGSGAATEPDHQFTPGTAMPLPGTGLEVTFSAHGIADDFWVIAARPNTPDRLVPWDLLEDAPPFGPRRYFGSLALITWSLDASDNVRASLLDCRTKFRPLCDHKGCCTYTVGDGRISQGVFNSIQDAIDQLPGDGGEICLLPGLHEGGVTISGKKNIKIHGCDKQTVVVPPRSNRTRPIFDIVDSICVTIAHLTAATFGGVAFRLAQTTDDALKEISISHNEIVAFRNAVQVNGGSNHHIYWNKIRMVDRDRAGEAIVIFAQDSLIERNDIGVRPAAPADPEEPPPGDQPESEDPCADLELVYNDWGILMVNLNVIFTILDALFVPTASVANPYRALGGIRIAAGSEDIQVLRNRITGGAGNGITLGGAPPLAQKESPPLVEALPKLAADQGRINAKVIANDAPVSGVALRFTATDDTSASLTATSQKGEGAVKVLAKAPEYSVASITPNYAVVGVESVDLGEFGIDHRVIVEEVAAPKNPPLGFIYDTVVESNEITGMGLSGIGSDFTTGATIPFLLNDSFKAYRRAPKSTAIGNPLIGGRITENTIAGNLLNRFDQAMLDLAESRGFGGISLDLASGLSINENVVANNGTSHQDPACGIYLGAGEKIEVHRNQVVDNGPTLTEGPGIRGGIVAGAATDLYPALVRLGFFRDYAIRIHDNLVRQPVGYALVLGGLGPMSVVSNRFQTLRPHPEAIGLIASTVLLLNVGSGSKGTTNFGDNQILAGPQATSFSNVLVVTKGDLGFGDNQVESEHRGLELPINDKFNLALLLNAILIGETLRASDSRFQEPDARSRNTGNIDLMLSLKTQTATMNNTVSNQADHCIDVSSNAGSSRERNSLNQILDATLCPTIRRGIDRPLKAYAINNQADQAFLPGKSYVLMVETADDQQSQAVQAQTSIALANLGALEKSLGTGLGNAEAEMRALIQNESARLATTSGSQISQRQAILQSHLDTRLNQTSALTISSEFAELDIPLVEEGGMLVHGRVTDGDERGIGGLLICAIDAEGETLEGIEAQRTDAIGYYSFALGASQVESLKESQPDGFHLSFFSQRGSPIFTTSNPILPEAGKTEVLNLHLDRDNFDVIDPVKPGPTPEPKLVTVPHVIGLSQEEAAARLETAGLALGTVGTVPVEEELIGTVTRQIPAANSQVAPGTTVDLSVGIEKICVMVPNVVGLTLAEAREVLAKENLPVESVEPEDAPEDSVVENQEPPAGTKVDPGTAVKLIVRPPDDNTTVAVPPLIGLTEDEAAARIKEAGLSRGIVSTAAADEDKIGTVTIQDPPAGTQVPPGTAVNFTIGTERSTITVPNVVGLSLTQAREVLAAEGLPVESVDPDDVPGESVVVRQEPPAGTQVDPGTAMKLIVRPPNDNTTIDVPPLIGLTEDEAAARLKESGLSIGDVSLQPPPGRNDVGRVIAQRPTEGTAVPPGSAVNLDVAGPSDPVERVLDRASRGRSFGRVGASKEKLIRVARENQLDSLERLSEIANEEDAAVRDLFKLQNLSSARALKRLILTSIEAE